MKRSKGLVAPAFQSDDEEFEFWETHDVEDYLTGEKVPLSSIIGAVPAPTSPDLVVTLRLRRGIEDRAPLSRHFGVAVPSTEADRDLRVVLQRELSGLKLDHYSVRYTSTDAHAGASAGPVRHLVVDMLVGDDVAAHEALDLAAQIAGSRPPARPTGSGSAGRTAMATRRHNAIVAIAKWLHDRDAIELGEHQADAILHP